ncbi:hypothetical protein TraAM80_07114 [Trypanosoma rangeli]|uniref:Transmembrane protein n=1 Tax=Trypanosoma rangeli TaxID=5698 RepID=A0A3S5IQM9_TRYRA|nr:uncharacterized protein TraAM80_07114 [Trypanosoma rangeli]RNF01253.1 hypothetical protein TraAM80_07114 [Trypanosoma rangeli]|eukprot:RNF01253.1 hypothetical protein TraAM80_07114 [Trypanosoma rangeli]
MTFGNDEQPANVTARRGGMAMTFGNDEQPASVTARRGGVAMTFGNDEQPANVTARRGGVAMSFANCSLGNRDADTRGGRNEWDETYVGNKGVEGVIGEVDFRRSASYRSPQAQRPTVCEPLDFVPGEPEPAVVSESGGPFFIGSTTRPQMRNMSPGPFCRGPGAAPHEDISGGTPAGRWRASSPGPTFGESGAGQGVRNGGNWQQKTRRLGVAREDSPVPGFTGVPLSRPPTVLDPFVRLSTRPSPHSGAGTEFQRKVGESHFYPPQNDRWQSHDAGNDLRRTGIPERRGESFWRPSSIGGPPQNGTSNSLASPVSSISNNGNLMREDANSRARGGFGGNFTPDTMHCFSRRQTLGRPNAGMGGAQCDATSINRPSNNIGVFTGSGNRMGAASNLSSNGIFTRMTTLYDGGTSRVPIIDEYDYPRNGSRVRPRGVQAMDLSWSGKWGSSRSAYGCPGGRGTPHPVSSRVVSSAMPWRKTTTTRTGATRRGLPATKPPLAPSSRAPFRPGAASAGARTTVTPSAVRGLTLRERVRLRQQQQRREANLKTFQNNLHENYCMGNDMKRCRNEVAGSFHTKSDAEIGTTLKLNTVTETIRHVAGASVDTAHNVGAAGAEAQAAATLDAYGDEVKRLESLTNPFVQADGVNVAFCLRDFVNAFLYLPGETLKEQDLTKAVWLDDGVSYFISGKPTRFCGGWESYLQHLNLYQQPFYLRERAFIFVLRVPYQPNLRVCVAVHNMDDFIALLQQQPLKKILLTKEEKWMQERLYKTGPEGRDIQAQPRPNKVGGFKSLLRRLHVFRKDKHAGETCDAVQQGGWAPMTWQRRWALLCLHVEATLRGSAWKTFTTPLLTDPALLRARMSFLSNRTATYAALRHRLNTLQALASSRVKKQGDGSVLQELRAIQERTQSAPLLPLESNRVLPHKEEVPPSLRETRTPAMATTTRRGVATSVTRKREPFRVNRVGDGSATALRRPRPARPPMQPTEMATTAATRRFSEVQLGAQTPCRATLAPYASSVSLSRPHLPSPATNSDTVGVAGQLLIRESEKDALVQVAENAAGRATFFNEVLPPPMTTVLKFMSSWDLPEQQKHVFGGCSKGSSLACITMPNPVFAGLLPTPTEIHRQRECFNISVSQLQQLLQWQWEYHQNCYEAFPLPVFSGALVAPTDAYFAVTREVNKGVDGTGVSPLSRSLLLALTKWGWMVPINYKASRSDARLHFLSVDWLPSFFGPPAWTRRGTFCFWLFVIGLWRNQVLWIASLYIVYACFRAAMRGVFGGCARRPAALDSATSIVYDQSEAAVEAMLERRQLFRTQSLAMRILRIQSYVQNVLSRATMLLCGYSPFLSLLIGLEVLVMWLLLIGYNYGVSYFLATTRFASGVMVGHLSRMLELLTFEWEPGVLYWCASLVLPSGCDGTALGFLFVLYFLFCLLPWSPLRWMCWRTWELFLYDDALVRRPLLSF